MPRIPSLPTDTNITAGDKLLVTDVNSQSATKLMTIEQLAAYLARTGKADSGRDSFIYTLVADASSDAQAELEDNNILASSVTQLIVSNVDVNGVEREPIFEELVGATIKISVVDLLKDINYGIYSLESISSLSGDRILLRLIYEHSPSTARFANGNTIAITGVSYGTINVADANQLRSGSGAPADTLGKNGDFYIDTDDFDLYGPKASGVWPLPPHNLENLPGIETPVTNSIASTEDASVTATLDEGNILFTFNIPRGTKGDKGDGWVAGTYDSSTGIITFTSDDGLGFTTGDLRGSDGSGWTGGSYDSSTGIVTFTSDDGLTFSTGDIRGADGQGWTGGSYDSSTGVVTFTSNDGLGFTTDDLRGADGAGFIETARAKEGDSTDLDITGVTSIAGGDHVSLKINGNTLVIDSTGGGPDTPQNPTFSLSTGNTFTSNQFYNVSQNVVFTAAVVPNDAENISITIDISGAETGNATDVSTTKSGNNYSTSQQAITPGGSGVTSNTVTAVATMTYNLSGSNDSETLTSNTVSLAANRTKPERIQYLSSPSGFEFTPSHNQIEEYDAGTYTIASDSSNTYGWTLSSETITPSDQVSGSTFTISAEAGDESFNKTATITQTSPPSGETAITESNYDLATDATLTRIKSLRVGSKPQAAFTSTQLQDLSSFNNGTNREIHFRTINPNGQTITLLANAGEYLFIMYDNNEADLDLANSQDVFGGNLNEIAGGFTQQTDVGGFTIYQSTNPSKALTSADNYQVTLAT